MNASRAQPAPAPAARFPVVPHYRPSIGAHDRAAVARLASRIAAEEPHLSSIPPVEGDLAIGISGGPNLLLEDHAGIQLARERGADRILAWRVLLLGGDGDLLVVGGERNPAFETYCRDFLGLGHVDIVPAPAVDLAHPLAIACCGESVLPRLTTVARRSGRLTLLPYMVTGGTWRLAAVIAEAAGVPVRVAGPPLGLARSANDKNWFAYCAARALGRDAVPASHTVYGMAGLVGHLRRLARTSGSVAVKLSHSAASLGNLVFDSAEIASLSPAELRVRLESLMRVSGWGQPFPLQVTAWESPLVGSPSAQLWIPLLGDGDPIVEAVFDQIVSGRVARFVGAEPSRLPTPLLDRIAREATLLGLLFQHLGWFGRCSFDAVIVDRGGHGDRLHWVECNGRWGGASIPMTLANRLVGDWAARGMLVLSRRVEGLAVHSTAEFFERCEPELFRPGAEGGVVLLSPGRLEAGTGIDLLAIGKDRAEVHDRADSLLAKLAA